MAASKDKQPDQDRLVALLAAECHVPIHTGHHPVYELGQLAASAMLQVLAGEAPTAQLPARCFIVRQSTQAWSAVQAATGRAAERRSGSTTWVSARSTWAGSVVR